MDKVNCQSHKTYFPFILIGLSVLLAAAFVAWYVPSGPPPFQGGDRGGSELGSDRAAGVDPGIDPSIAPTHDQYVAAVAPILGDYLVDQDANRAYTRLAEITVPVDDLGTHLELVIVFGKFQAGETAEASTRYQSLKQKISWLP